MLAHCLETRNQRMTNPVKMIQIVMSHPAMMMMSTCLHLRPKKRSKLSPMSGITAMNTKCIIILWLMIQQERVIGCLPQRGSCSAQTRHQGGYFILNHPRVRQLGTSTGFNCMLFKHLNSIHMMSTMEEFFAIYFV